jgi:hypothetical protein
MQLLIQQDDQPPPPGLDQAAGPPPGAQAQYHDPSPGRHDPRSEPEAYEEMTTPCSRRSERLRQLGMRDGTEAQHRTTTIQVTIIDQITHSSTVTIRMVTRTQVSIGLIVTVGIIEVILSSVTLPMAAEATKVTHLTNKVTKVTPANHHTIATRKVMVVTRVTQEIGVNHHLITDRKPTLTTECHDQTVKPDRVTTEVTAEPVGRQVTTENVYQVSTVPLTIKRMVTDFVQNVSPGLTMNINVSLTLGTPTMSVRNAEKVSIKSLNVKIPKTSLTPEVTVDLNLVLRVTAKTKIIDRGLRVMAVSRII